MTTRHGAWRFVVEQTGPDFETVSIEEATSKSDPYPRKRALYRRTINRKIKYLCVSINDLLDLMIAKGWLSGVYDPKWEMSIYVKAYDANVPLKLEILRPRKLTEEPGWLIDDWGVCVLADAAVVNLDTDDPDERDVNLPSPSKGVPSDREIWRAAKGAAYNLPDAY